MKMNKGKTNPTAFRRAVGQSFCEEGSVEKKK